MKVKVIENNEETENASNGPCALSFVIYDYLCDVLLMQISFVLCANNSP